MLNERSKSSWRRLPIASSVEIVLQTDTAIGFCRQVPTGSIPGVMAFHKPFLKGIFVSNRTLKHLWHPVFAPGLPPTLSCSSLHCFVLQLTFLFPSQQTERHSKRISAHPLQDEPQSPQLRLSTSTFSPKCKGCLWLRARWRRVLFYTRARPTAFRASRI